MQFNLEENKLVIGELRTAEDGSQRVEVQDEYSMVEVRDGERQLRVLVRGMRVEVYIDGQWIFATPTVEGTENDKVGLLASGGTVQIKNVRIAELKPLVPATATLPELKANH